MGRGISLAVGGSQGQVRDLLRAEGLVDKIQAISRVTTLGPVIN